MNSLKSSHTKTIRIDFIDRLPPGVSHMILDKLDPKPLHHTPLVSTKWFSVCKSNAEIRAKIRSYIISTIQPPVSFAHRVDAIFDWISERYWLAIITLLMLYLCNLGVLVYRSLYPGYRKLPNQNGLSANY